MDDLLNFTDKDLEKTAEEFVKKLAEYFDEKLDEDGSKYDLALSYVKKKGIDTDDIEALAKVIESINQGQDALTSKLAELIDMADNEEELNETFEEINYYRNLSIGILSIMLDFKNCGLKS